MKKHPRRLAAAGVITIVFLIGSPSAAHAPSGPFRVEEDLFRPVSVPPAPDAPMRDFLVTTPPALERPVAELPPDVLHVEPRATATTSSGTSFTGVASWYCLAGVSRCTNSHPGGLYAAVRRDLLFLRGQNVTVCAGPDDCVSVTIIDCNCGPGANLVDLYADAFEVLAPLSRGRIEVTLSR